MSNVKNFSIMSTVLHIILQKSAIKLYLIVLFMFVFINENYSQVYSPELYRGSYSHSIYKISGFGILDLNRYEINVTVNYSGGGMYNPNPLPYITDYLSVSSSTFNNTYTYSVIRRNIDINDSEIVIYYDLDTSCPNYNMPCN